MAAKLLRDMNADELRARLAWVEELNGGPDRARHLQTWKNTNARLRRLEAATPATRTTPDTPTRKDRPMTAKDAIEKVLAGKRKPLTAREITEQAVPLATGLKGKTPDQTMTALLYREAKRPDGLVTLVDRGAFKLNPGRATGRRQGPPAKAAARTGKRAGRRAR